MPVYIKRSIDNEKYMKQLIDKKMKAVLLSMSKDIQNKTRELEPPQYVKDSFAEKLRRYIGI